jgi:CRP-like cAMP-binding protein
MGEGSVDTALRYLSAVPYLAPLGSETVARLARTMRRMDFDPKAEIIAEGEACEGVYLILDGQVRLVRRSPDGREHVLWVLGPGATFNEAAVFDGGPNAETAVAAGAASVGLIPKARIMELLREHPDTGRLALKVLGERQRAMSGVIEDLALRDVTGRVARLLLGCAGRHGHIIDKAEFACTHVTHQDIAAMVGSVREVVQRVLKGLEQAGAIDLSRGEIRVKDVAILQRMSGE